VTKSGVGLIGCGSISRAHMSDYYTLDPEDARLVACAEPDSATRERFVAAFTPPKMYASVAELLADPEVEVVDICTPPATHPELIRQAARAGKHVLTEKPLAVDLADARDAIEVAERAGVTVAVMQNYRFRPEYIEARAQLTGGRLGRPFFVSFEGLYHWNGGANYRRQAERMLIIEQTYHYIDLLRFILDDDVERVYAVAGRPETSVTAGETWAALTLHFSRGAVGTIVNSGECYGFPANWGGSAVVQCTAGTLEINRRQLYSLSIYAAGGGGRLPERVFPSELYAPSTNAPFTRPLEAYHRAFRTGQKPPVTARENLNTLATAFSCYESIERGQVVDVPPDRVPVAR
jgi:predicted dehydrogenase